MSEDVTQTEDVTTDVAPAPDYGDWKSVSAGLAGENTDLATELSGYESFDAFLEAKSQPAEFDWRAELKGEGEDSALFDRYTDLSSLGKAFLEQRKLIGAKSGATLPGADATDDQLRDFRAAHGIPERADGYKNIPAPPDGMELSEEDQAFLSKAVEKLHGKSPLSAHPDTVSAAHEVYYDLLEEREAMLDAHAKKAAEDTIKWRQKTEGASMAANTQMVTSAIQQLFDVDDPDQVLGLRLMDGSYLGANQTVVKGLLQIGQFMMTDPVYAQTMTAGEGQGTLEDRKAEIMALKRSDPKKYGSEAVQGELDKINTMLLTQKRRNAA